MTIKEKPVRYWLKVKNFNINSYRSAVVTEVKNGGEWWSFPATVQGLRVVSRTIVNIFYM